MTLKIDLPDEQTAVLVATAQALGVSRRRNMPGRFWNRQSKLPQLKPRVSQGKNIEELFAACAASTSISAVIPRLAGP